MARVMGSAVELGEGGGADVGGRPTAQIEFYHTLCLLQGGKPLGAPFLAAVGGLVADFDSHRSGVGCLLMVDGMGAAVNPL
jgi:hypothetical protein